MKNSGKAHLFLQEMLEWHLELFIFFKRHLHLSMQYLLQWQLTNTCFQMSLRLTEEIANLRAHHVPWWSCFQQLWIHCEHTATQVGLPSCPTDKAQMSWHQRRLLGHFWGLDVLRGQAPWPQRLPYINCWKFWVGERNYFFELVPNQILHLLAQCWFDSSLHRGWKWLSVWNPHCLQRNFHK